MIHDHEFPNARLLSGFDRTPFDQVAENLNQALRVLDLMPSQDSDLTPHPLVTARAEIRNAQRYLSQIRGDENRADVN